MSLLGGGYMKVKEDFVLRKVADSYVVVPVNKMTLNFNGIITLNETGAFLWREAEKGDFSVESLTAALLNEYEVDEATATRDVASFVAKLNEQKLAEE